MLGSAILVLMSKKWGLLAAIASLSFSRIPLSFEWLPNVFFGWIILEEFQVLFGIFVLLIALALFKSRKMKTYELSAMVIFCSGLLGFIGASHPIQFFMFLELMIFPAFYLIFKRDSTAAFKYFIYMQISSIFILVGMVSGGTVATMFLTIGFAIKIGFFPLSSWLPDAHSQAPTTLSALLSSLLVAGGLYGLYRFTYDTTVILIFSVISLIYGAVMAATEDDLKRLLAYSTISQMGMAGLALVFAPKFLPLFLVMHSLAKFGLFIVADSLIKTIGIRNISQISISSKSLAFVTFVSSLSLAGFPLFLGFWVELEILKGVFATSFALGGLVIFAMLFTILYVEKIISIFTKKNPKKLEDWIAVIPTVLLILGVLLLE